MYDGATKPSKILSEQGCKPFFKKPQKLRKNSRKFKKKYKRRFIINN